MMAVSLEQDMRANASQRVGQAIENSIPDFSAGAGLAAFLHAIQEEMFVHDPSVADVLDAAWGWKGSTTSVSTRFARAKLVSPDAWIRAVRAAACGVLLAEGADVVQAAVILDSSAVSNLYKQIGRLEVQRGRVPLMRHHSPGWVIGQMRKRAPLWAFNRYVKPLLPPAGDRRWRVELLPVKRRA